MIKTNLPAPDFTLKDQDGTDVKLSDFKGKKNVVLIFYPFDFSPVCGDEVALFNQTKPMFDERNAELLGISCDSVYAHKEFEQTRNIHFDLLSDFEPKGAVSKLYDSYNKDMGCSARNLFLIDKNQMIVWNYESPLGENPGADGVLAALDKL